MKHINNRNKALPRLSLLALISLALFSSHLFAEERYISDVLYVPLRSGQGDQYRIIHRGLPSGTKVTLLEENSETGYSLVEIDNGNQGWIRSRYLLAEPTAQMKLDQVLAQQTDSGQEELQQQLTDLQQQVANLNTQNEQLTTEKAELQGQFDALQQLSGNVININENNKRLVEKNQLLRGKVDSLEAANEKLKDNSDLKLFIYGGILVLITLLINAWLDGLKRKRSYNSWG